MNLIKKILGLFDTRSVDEQERDYISKYGYPDNTVIFTDVRGRISRIIGKNEFLEVANSDWYKAIAKGVKEKGYFEIESL